MRLLIAGSILFLTASLVWSELRIPNRPSQPLFKGAQGHQRSEIHYDPGTGTVTLKLLVQDPNGYFIPDIRRENFVVYENGVRQDNLSVTVEHAAVSMGLLLEHGGRFPTLNRDLTAEVSRAGYQLLEDLGPQDEASVWAYADSVSQLADFTSNRQTLQQMLLSLKPPDVSEANLYDAVIWAIKRMRPVATRKATVLISSGVDTFSKATFKDAAKAAGQSDAPVYAISLAKVMQADAELRGVTTVKIDWNGCDKNVGEIARASGGRLYSPSDTITLAPTYDDLIQNLKVRYVLAYRSSNHNSPNVPRTVRVELVEPVSGKALPIKDANGRLVRATVISEERYTPTQASGTSSR